MGCRVDFIDVQIHIRRIHCVTMFTQVLVCAFATTVAALVAFPTDTRPPIDGPLATVHTRSPIIYVAAVVAKPEVVAVAFDAVSSGTRTMVQSVATRLDTSLLEEVLQVLVLLLFVLFLLSLCPSLVGALALHRGPEVCQLLAIWIIFVQLSAEPGPCLAHIHVCEQPDDPIAEVNLSVIANINLVVQLIAFCLNDNVWIDDANDARKLRGGDYSISILVPAAKHPEESLHG
mmetsp:Transcript_31920/g.56300  ORF Transcript_31920/g.56300 Transcript_31920/m.56300 type:complete len:232 (+) Transcript_31920:473-1168(+)